MEEYKKPSLTIEEQVNLLKNKGLIFSNEEDAKNILSNISYYRISAYTTPFKKIVKD